MSTELADHRHEEADGDISPAEVLAFELKENAQWMRQEFVEAHKDTIEKIRIKRRQVGQKEIKSSVENSSLQNGNYATMLPPELRAYLEDEWHIALQRIAALAKLLGKHRRCKNCGHDL